LIYKDIKIKELIRKTGRPVFELKHMIPVDSELKKEMQEKNITFYSLRHTFHTMFDRQHPDKARLLDYFVGHKSGVAMRDNYSHMSDGGDISFWNDCKILTEFQEQFIPNISEGDRKALRKSLKKPVGGLNPGEHLTDEKLDSLIDNIIAPYISDYESEKPSVENIEDDEFFSE